MAAVTDTTNGHDITIPTIDPKEVKKPVMDKAATVTTETASVKREPEKSTTTTTTSAPLVNGNGTASNGDAVKVNGGVISANGTSAKEKEVSVPIVKNENSVKKRKKRKDSLADDDNNHQAPIGKRVRLQHQPFQSPAVKNVVPSFFRPPPPSSKNGFDGEDKIVVFSKGDFLAVRNELNGFYVCRTAQNVYKDSRKFKIQWLNDEKDHYKPDFFDKTDFECVLTNLRLVRLGKGRYQLPEDERKRATNILQRALNVEKGLTDIPDPRLVTADGVDVSIIGKEEEEKLVKEIVSKLPREKSIEKEEKKESKQSSGKSSRRASTDVSSVKTSRSSSRRASTEIEKPAMKTETKMETASLKTKKNEAKSSEKVKTEIVKAPRKRGRKKKLKLQVKKERTLRPRGQEPIPTVVSTTPPAVVKKTAVPKTVIPPPVKSKVTPVKPMVTKPKRMSEKAIREKRQIPNPIKKLNVIEKKVIETEVKKSPKAKIPSPIQIKTPTSPKKDHHRPVVEFDLLADLTGIAPSSTKEPEQPAYKLTPTGLTCSILTAINGNTGQIKAMIAEGADVNEAEINTGNTALHLLCKTPKKSEKLLETLKEILKHNPNINCINKDGRTPLHFASNSVQNEIDLTVVETLLAHGALRRIKDKDGRIPLHYSFVKIDKDDDISFSDPIELTIMLTNGDPDSVNETDTKGILPIHRAAQRGGTFSVAHLIRCSKNQIDCRDSFSNTPLSNAIKGSFENCTFSMILKGCNFGLSIPKSTQSSPTGRWTWVHLINVPKVPEESSLIFEIMKRKWNRLIHLLLEMMPDVGQDLSHALIAAIKCQNLKLAIKIAKRMKPNLSGPFLHSLSEIPLNEENKEKLIELLDLILEKSLCKLDTLDHHNCSPLITAAIAHNAFFCEEITKRLSLESNQSALNSDRFGRTPLTSILYRSSIQDIDSKVQSWALKLASGKSSLWDGPCYFAVKESIFPCVRFVHDESLFASKYPPLIWSVIKGNFHEVKFLMSQKVDVNVTDDHGRTAIMHAVRLNDIKMVKALLTSRYDQEMDFNPWSSRFLTFKKSTSTDLTLVDHHGNTVVHHVVAPMADFTYSCGDVILRLLASAGAPLDISNSVGKTPIQLATERKAEKLIQTLKDLLPEEKLPKTSDVLNGDTNGTHSEKVTERDVPNFESDASTVLESLQTIESSVPLKVVADKLIGYGDSSEVVMDESQSIPYSVLLVKPDKDSWGVSHFYKLQVVIHKQRNLVVLFTHYGQLGQVGTHLKKNFSRKSEAIEEFVKQFKFNTGNNWSPLDKFVPVPKKYRLIPMKIKTSDIEAKLNNLKILKEKEKNPIKSCLRDEVSGLIGHVMADLMTPMSNEDIDCVTCVKLITDSVVKKAEDILFEIGVIIGEREKELKGQINGKKSSTSTNVSKVLDQLTDLSDEFFNLIPIPMKSRLVPILNETDHRLKNDILRRIRSYIISGKILIGSYSKLPTINQLDYIYDCLKCHINQLDPVSIESQILLQFIHNSSLNQKINKPIVESIFEICKKSQADQLVKTNVSNHWLLFHSVTPKELLNILSSGLQITSSDTFMKGISFSDSICAITKQQPTTKYVLVCEVALGKVEETTNSVIVQPVDTGYNSVKRKRVRWQPDPVQSVYWDGRVIPVGPLIEDTSSEVTHQFNEYVVFDSSQVCIRYLIQVSQQSSSSSS